MYSQDAEEILDVNFLPAVSMMMIMMTTDVVMFSFPLPYSVFVYSIHLMGRETGEIAL